MTTLGVGGPARFFLEAPSAQAVVDAMRWANDAGVDVVVLGGGSNLLVADRGFDGLVLRVAMGGVDAADEGDRVRVRAAAGITWDDLVARSVAEGWAGIECLSGIPGLVGATPIQNVGAYGQEVAETIAQVTAIDRETLTQVTFEAGACGFGYRDSLFKREWRGRCIVTHVTFLLTRGGAPAVRYGELARRLSHGTGPEPSLADVRRAVLNLRRSKSMVLDADDENRRSAGSFFVNPTVDSEQLAEVRDRVARAGVLQPGESMPEHAAAHGRVKLSAAWLIERAGFAKGTRDGSVGISTRHSLAIINLGTAKASNLLGFATRVRDRVRDQLGVALVPEPVPVGFRAGELRDLFDPRDH